MVQLMKLNVLIVISMMVAAFAWPFAANAEPRLALVIGNGGYASGPLANPPNDARLMSKTLEAAGFEVAMAIDADQTAMKQQIRAFAIRLKRAGPNAVAAFYYAGHGVQVNGRNYLIPVGAPIGSAADLEYETVEAQWVLDLIGESQAGLSMIILDACRNNPFPAVSRAASRGLARMDAPRGSILAYSTAPGDVALDGVGVNSPFTEALSTAMRSPGLKIEETFKAARRAVLAATGGRQTPWESSSLVGDFYFTPGGAGQVQPVFAPGAPTAPGTGQSFRDCPDCPEMVSIGGGATTMGSAAGSPGHEGHEAPPTTVSIRPFALGRTEVTRGQYAAFLRDTGRSAAEGCWYYAVVWLYDGARNWRAPGYAQTDEHPAVCVRWSDAVAYADWLSAKTGARYRLPSEAEWEFAAQPTPWGGDENAACAYDNVHDVTANAAYASGLVFAYLPCEDGMVDTSPAGSFRANAKGLSDVLGNAWEWTADCWNGSHSGRPSDGAVRRGGDCGHRVVKGGNFVNYASSFRPAFRFKALAEYPNIYLGFRVARDVN